MMDGKRHFDLTGEVAVGASVAPRFGTGGQNARPPMDGRSAGSADLVPLRDVASNLERERGGIDILFPNAGIQDFKLILEMEDADWYDQVDVNHALIPALINTVLTRHEERYARAIDLAGGVPTADKANDERTAVEGLDKTSPHDVQQHLFDHRRRSR